MICTDQVCKSGSSDYASDRMISCPSDHSSHQTTLIARNVPLDKSRPLDQIDDLYEICTVLYGSYFLFFFLFFWQRSLRRTRCGESFQQLNVLKRCSPHHVFTPVPHKTKNTVGPIFYPRIALEVLNYLSEIFNLHLSVQPFDQQFTIIQSHSHMLLPESRYRQDLIISTGNRERVDANL